MLALIRRINPFNRGDVPFIVAMAAGAVLSLAPPLLTGINLTSALGGLGVLPAILIPRGAK